MTTVGDLLAEAMRANARARKVRALEEEAEALERDGAARKCIARQHRLLVTGERSPGTLELDARPVR